MSDIGEAIKRLRAAVRAGKPGERLCDRLARAREPRGRRPLPARKVAPSETFRSLEERGLA